MTSARCWGTGSDGIDGTSVSVAGPVAVALAVAVVCGAEDLRDAVAALFHADQAEAETGDGVPDRVVRLLARDVHEQQMVGRRRPVRAAARGRGGEPGPVEGGTQRGGAVRVLVG